MPALPSRYANQSVTVDEVLDALGLLIRKATGLTDRKVVEWYGNERPSLEGTETVCWFRWLEEGLEADAGSGRHGTPNNLLMEVNLRTRGFKDQAGKDKKVGRAHLAKVFQVVNALYGQMLFSAYDDPVGDEPPQPTIRTRMSADEVERRRTSLADEDARILTVADMRWGKLPKPNRPDAEQGTIETRIGVVVPVVLRTTINSAPPLEDRK